MKKPEMLKLFKYLHSYYDEKFTIPDEKNDLKLKIETWLDFLGDYDYKVVQIATKKIVSQKIWPPTPGEIMKEIEKTKQPEQISGQEAWGRVIELVRRYGCIYGENKIMEKLSEEMKKAVISVGGLQVIGMSQENDTYLMNNFIKAFESITERAKEIKMLPQSLREEMEKLKRPEVDQLVENVKKEK